jgi:hypothetical protein
VIRRSDGIPEGLVLRAERNSFAEETRDESSLVCNLPDVVRLRVVVCAGRSRAEADGPPPISCSPITSATSEPRRASSLRIVTQNLECDVQERMQRVSAPLISSPFRWNIAGAAPIGIVARGAGLRARGLGSRVGPQPLFCRPGQLAVGARSAASCGSIIPRRDRSRCRLCRCSRGISAARCAASSSHVSAIFNSVLLASANA